ncbi:SVEP1-like protein [Mya arenaria]|uniref:SVEP1-like protein n=1 Tax=Mya arenaria TaxID=6604 RepID=A0ABY7FVD5_MYAAR|nr:uncharacterized protein LOC128216411 [Mya arenaria]WAR25119.1 SVEP1-like protein [Mya arenaria]
MVNRQIRLTLIWILVDWLIICVLGYLGNITYPKRCYDNSLHVFYTQTAFSLDECIRECQLRTRCFGTRYNNHYKHCSLLDPVDLDRLQDESPGCLFTNISQWEHQNLGSCAGHNCSMSEVCIPVNPTDHECMTSHCEMPPVVANARTLAGTQLLGSRNLYICNVGYSRVGDPVVKCQDDGQWTKPDFYCIKQCRRPKADHYNAYLIGADVVNNFAPGTTLYFRCKEGFHSAGTFTSNTCNDQFNWTHGDKILCCRDDKHYYQERCFLPFGQGTASSFQEIKSHCQSLGGWQGDVYKGYAEHIEAMGVTYDLLINVWQKKDFETWRNLTSNCLVPNFGSDLSQFSGMSYGDIVHYVNDNFDSLGAEDNQCWWANLWGPGLEPNGGDSEPCTFLLKSNGYQGLGDISCNFQNLNIGFVCHFPMDTVNELP